MTKIVIPGGTGQVGGILDRALTVAGHDVTILTRHPANDREVRTLRAAWGVPVGLPATKRMAEIGAFAMRSDTELLLKSRRVVPGRLLEAGFAFDCPDWPQAAEDLVRSVRAR